MGTDARDEILGEYGDLVRAARKRLELERLFGVESVFFTNRVQDGPADAEAPQEAGVAPSGVPGRGDGEGKRKMLTELRLSIEGCTRCPLHSGRKNIVFGQGDPDARLCFVGEAPGRDEDLQGIAFVGRAGQLLTRIIAAMGFTREEVYIANIIKCRPPGNRNPNPAEIMACYPFLLKQLEIIQPEVLCALGSVAAKTLLETRSSIGRLRGRFHDFRGIPLMPTYHPAYLLRNPGEKKKVWEDVKKIMKRLAKNDKPMTNP
jgi:DNA polymerase